MLARKDKMNWFTRFGFGLALVATMAVLAACGSESASEGGSMEVAISTEAGDLDPHGYESVFSVQSMVYEPLIRYGGGGKLEPWLAEAWEVSGDGKVIRFDLRPNVEFSDGTPWDAEALKWNFDRWVTKGESGWLGVATAYDKGVVVDPMTYELHLKEPYPQALQELSFVRPVRFLSPKAVGPDEKYTEPVGTGPWMVEENTAERTVLVRNDSYWGEKPLLDRIELTVITDGQSRLSALRAGDIDVTGGTYVAALSAEQAVTLRDGGGGTLVVGEGDGTLVLGFNIDREVFQDPRVREAVSLAIDRGAISEAVFGGLAEPAGDLFPETIPNSGERHPAPTQDIEKAEALLDEAGWTLDGDIRVKEGQPFEVSLLVSEERMPGMRAMAEVLQSELREVGIDVHIDAVDHAVYHDAVPARNWDINFFFTYGAPYDPFSTLLALFTTDVFSGVDGKVYFSEELDKLIDEANSALTAEQQASAYQAVYDLLTRERAFAPLVYLPRLWAHGDEVNDFSIPPTDYEMPYEGISTDGS